MVDINDSAIGADEDVKDIPPVVHPEAIKLQDDVKESIEGKQKGGEIRQRVVDALVEDEVGIRADLLTKALAKRKAQAKELEKIRPDNVSMNADGSVALELYSKPQVTERQKAEKALNKIDKAINAAVQNADYEGIKKIAQ